MVLYSKYANKINTSNGTTLAINVQEVSLEAILMTIQYLMLFSPSANQHYQTPSANQSANQPKGSNLLHTFDIFQQHKVLTSPKSSLSYILP